jgi:hypothetical protein
MMIYRGVNPRNNTSKTFTWLLAIVAPAASMPGAKSDQVYYTSADGPLLVGGKVNPLPCEMWKNVHKRVEHFSAVVMNGHVSGVFRPPSQLVAPGSNGVVAVSVAPSAVQVSTTVRAALYSTCDLQPISEVSPLYAVMSATTDVEVTCEDDSLVETVKRRRCEENRGEVLVGVQSKPHAVDNDSSLPKGKAVVDIVEPESTDHSSALLSTATNVIAHEHDTVPTLPDSEHDTTQQFSEADLDVKIISFFKRERFLQKESRECSVLNAMFSSFIDFHSSAQQRAHCDGRVVFSPANQGADDLPVRDQRRQRLIPLRRSDEQGGLLRENHHQWTVLHLPLLPRRLQEVLVVPVLRVGE